MTSLLSRSTADSIPILRSGFRRPGQWTSWLSGAWSPAALLAAGAAPAVGAAALVRGRTLCSFYRGRRPPARFFANPSASSGRTASLNLMRVDWPL